MADILTIQKNRKLPASQDYELLRTEGLQHIENLSHDLWTDYNTHDPGITILEALCYAITELGYRCGFDMKDLLTDANGKTVQGQNFFTAKSIFTVNPLTKNDYRKLLVDIAGIQNAWLIAEDFQEVDVVGKIPVNEVPVYINCAEDKLDYTKNENPVFLSGLYRVLLSLDYDETLGDLNNGDIVIENPELIGEYHAGEFLFSIELPSWKNADFDFAELAKVKDNINSAVISSATGSLKCLLTLSLPATAMSFGITVSKQPPSGKVTEENVQLMFNNKDFVASIFENYFNKIQKAEVIVKTAVKKLHEHRNLCEDYISVTTADDDQIAFCMDVDVKPDGDIEKVQAEIFFAIENYLNPAVHFYLLKELMDKKIPVDEIFSGPILEHGFIDTIQLEQTNLRTVIHASDIINLLMDIEGVTAIRNFMMTKYGEDGRPVNNFISLKWCMPVTHLHKPVLRIDKSKILLFKSQFPFIARYDEVHDTILLLHAIQSGNKAKGFQDDLPVPAGIKRDTGSHWPVQYDFPQTYGIGEAGLPLNVSDERRAQQRQLKTYLMFYEQLLADFYSQLSNSYQLFSSEKIVQTYFAQFLNDIKDIEPVYKTNLTGVLLQNTINIADSTTEVKSAWQGLYESKELFENRRNRFLDHLLARFAESFNDYALLMYKMNYEDQTEKKIDFNELSDSKIHLLKNYDDISSNRGRAFNYYPQTTDLLPDVSQYWDTDNVSGLEKRICFLTGVEDFTRRFLYCIKNIEINCEEREEGEKLVCIHTFTVTTIDGIVLNSEEYDEKAEAEKAVLEAIKSGDDEDNYLFDTVKKELQLIGGGSGSTGKILLKAIYPDKDAAVKGAKIVAAEFSKKCGNPEGLHLIEHILLRPRPVNDPDKKFDLMQVCLDDCDCICEMDPYSFRASVVLPYWPGHFNNMAFRQYFENKIREEAPAHVMLKICWLNNDKMREFEITYKKWIEKLAEYSFDLATNTIVFRDANDAMIKILNELHSEYPKATLHNCDESKEGMNTVVLNKTVLGTF